MRKPIRFVVLLAFLLFACSIPSTITPLVTEPPVTELPVTVPPVTEPPVTEPPLLANATCYELSLYLDPALASDYTCEIVPEVLVGIMTNPQYTLVTLQGYDLAYEYHTAHIAVLPIQPDFDPGVAGLQALIAGGAPGETLPYVPQPPAAEEFFAQYQIVPFASGNGIRYLTQFVQMQAPVSNQLLIYTFQGITSDGKYWISVTLPDSHPSLPSDSNTLPAGQTWDQFLGNFDTYITDLKSQLNVQPADSFQPSLTALDQLVNSITIQP